MQKKCPCCKNVADIKEGCPVCDSSGYVSEEEYEEKRQQVVKLIKEATKQRRNTCRCSCHRGGRCGVISCGCGSVGRRRPCGCNCHVGGRCGVVPCLCGQQGKPWKK